MSRVLPATPSAWRRSIWSTSLSQVDHLRARTRVEAHSHDQQHQGKLPRLSCPSTYSGSRMYTTSKPRPDGSQPEEAPARGWVDDFAIIFEKAKPANRGLAVKRSTGPSEPAPSIPATEVPSVNNVRRLLLDLSIRTLKYGLLPEVTAVPTVTGPTSEIPCWKVTIALDELGISVSSHGSTRMLAEVAASIQFELMLSSPETLAKLETFPLVDVGPRNAVAIIVAYCRMMSIPTGDLRRDVTKTVSDAYEARIFSGERQLGKPAVSAVGPLAKSISPLALANDIVKGHSELWPAGPENPFLAKIVVDEYRMELLQSFIRAAKHYLTTVPGLDQDGKPHGSYYLTDKDVNNGESQSTSQDSAVRQSPDLDTFLTTLPFPSSTAKMLLLGGSVRCIEPTIILAALGKHDVYRKLEHAETFPTNQSNLNPHLTNTLHGDHSELVLFYQRCRKEIRKDAESARNIAGRYAQFDPDGIRSVNTAARDIERILRSASLAGPPEGDSNIDIPGSKLEVRRKPYGGSLNMNSTKMPVVRHLLALGFGHNIAQYGYGTLIPGALPELRVGSQQVHIGSPLRSPMSVKQLQKILENGPLAVLSGTSEDPEGRGLTAQYSSPISTWQAVLFGEDLSVAEETGVPPQPDTAQLVINGWLPVFVKSQIPGLSDKEVRGKVLEAREVLHDAMHKAVEDYVKHSWSSIEFYKLLKDVPIEAVMNDRQQETANGEAQDTVAG